MNYQTDWEIMHAYMRAKDANMVPPIMCPDHDWESLFPGQDEDGDPVLKCLQGHAFGVGTWVLDQLRDNLVDAYRATASYRELNASK